MLPSWCAYMYCLSNLCHFVLLTTLLTPQHVLSTRRHSTRLPPTSSPSACEVTPPPLTTVFPNFYLPSNAPSEVPSSSPKMILTTVPSNLPSNAPSSMPPSSSPSMTPTSMPSYPPSGIPSSMQPFSSPSMTPISTHSSYPPSGIPSRLQPSPSPSMTPISTHSSYPPSGIPSRMPSSSSPAAILRPSYIPSVILSAAPNSLKPIYKLSALPSSVLTNHPLSALSMQPALGIPSLVPSSSENSTEACVNQTVLPCPLKSCTEFNLTVSQVPTMYPFYLQRYILYSKAFYCRY